MYANDNDAELFAVYLAGMLDSEERERVETRLRADPVFRARFEEARFAWTHAQEAYDAPVSETRAARVWAELSARIDAAGPAAQSSARRSRGRPNLWQGIAAAALGWRRPFAPAAAALAAVLLLGLGLGSYMVVTRFSRPAASVAASPMLELAAQPGTVGQFELSDGTEVWLAPGGVLRAPERFATDARAVSLSGRAFFVVAHDPARPFTVETGRTVTRVLGTEFDVRAYPDEAEVEVMVRSGSVAVRAGDSADSSATVLVPGARGTVHRQGDVHVTEVADLDAELAWIDGRLVFDRMPLREVAIELERWAGVDIRITDESIEQLRLTAVFERESLDRILEIVARLLEVGIERQADRVVISPR